MLLQAATSPEVQASWGGLQVAAFGIVLSLLTALGAFGANFLRGKGKLVEQDLELKQKELELRRLEIEEKIRAKQKAAAVDAASIVEETARHTSLSGPVKQSLAAEKLLELEPGAKSLEGSALTDLVKLGVASLRHASATTYLVTPSMAPPPEQVSLPQRLPAPAALPAYAPLTRTSPERPGAKR